MNKSLNIKMEALNFDILCIIGYEWVRGYLDDNEEN